MKRAGVYVFYDKDGVVDRYVPYFIKELHKVVDYIVVVVNGTLKPEGRSILVNCADDLFVRENVGYDSLAYKAGIEYIGWDALSAYDELVIANNSIIGPIYPFQEAFDKMGASDCDFWGMQTAYEDKTQKNWFGVPLKWGHKPDSIASNFHVYKSSVLHSYEFRRFWEKLPHIKNYFEACVYMEMAITNDLSDAGFVGEALDQGAFRHTCPSPMVYGAYDMITQYRIPIIRKKSFFDPNSSLDYCRDIPRQMMEHIAEHTDYDCALIWESLLRTENQYDLKNWFNLNMILSKDYAAHKPENVKIAVIFHHYYTDIMEQYLHNIEAFPDGTDFYFTTDSEEKQEALKALIEPVAKRFHVEYRLVENRGRDVSALLVGCRDVVLSGVYDLICFMHDKKAIGNLNEYACVGEAFSDTCFENIAPTAAYVNNVIDLFQREPNLGIAVPPPPKNAGYYRAIGGTWTTNYQNTVQFLKRLNISVPLDAQKPPISPYGSVFWFRPKALLPLFEEEWDYEDFAAEPMPIDGTISHAIERSHSLIAQGQGYYPTVIMNSSYAEQEVTRMTDIAHTYVGFAIQYVGHRKMLKLMTVEFGQLLHRLKNPAPPPKKAPIQTAAAAVLPQPLPQPQRKPRGRVKSFVRGVCPIGLWNLMRKVKCTVAGDIYIEPKVERSAFKNFVRACMPRFLWDQLRKAKCKENGWIYVAEE